MLGNLNVPMAPDATAWCLVRTAFNSEQLPSHPTLTTVWIGKSYANDEAGICSLLTDYGQASHLRSGRPSLGGAHPRFASPLWGSARMIGGQLYPVISELQSSRSREAPTASYKSDRDKFLQMMGVKI